MKFLPISKKRINLNFGHRIRIFQIFTLFGIDIFETCFEINQSRISQQKKIVAK